MTIRYKSFFSFYGINLLSVVPWVLAIYFFGISAIINDVNHDQYKAKLFIFITNLFLIWVCINEVSNHCSISRKPAIIAKILVWVILPATVIYLTVSNGVFQMRIKGIDSNLSIIPIIIQIYAILLFYELESYLSKNISISEKYTGSKKVLLFFAVRIIVIMNIYLCGYLVVSWASWYRSLTDSPL